MVLIMVHDATDERRKKAELEVKSTMIQEVHHRVKNNLQNVAAVLRMQQRRAHELETKQALSEAIARILSVAVIHEFLSLDESQSINIRDVCQRIVTQTRQVMAPGKQIEFSIEGPAIYLPSQQATATALVINELVQNALEHGFETQQQGQVRVVLTDGGDSVKLEVCDDGEPLQEGFDLGNTSSLGLQIVRSLVQADLRGAIRLENDAERGVVATVIYPKAVINAGRRSRVAPQPYSDFLLVSQEGKMERTRVIIADDESLIRMDLREMLTNLGYLVVGEVADGRSAVNQARELRPDVVIMDIKMPDMDGIEAAKVLTEERIAPVVLLSAYSQRDLVQRARDAGVVAYLVKPYREEELSPAIEVALARFAEFKDLQKQVSDLQEALETRKLVDRAKGILMDKQGLTEAEAFRKIQKMSMDNRKPMKDVAEAIILAHQVGQG